MEDIKSNEVSPFNIACKKILVESPEAIGVAYKVLDCGCALLCGTSAGGEPIGFLQHISGQSVKKGNPSPICLKCRKDNGAGREIWDGIYWPGTQNEWPDKDLRILIGQKIFGPRYLEPE